jgi:MFS transporter, ACS family, tartrate transporter
MISGTRTGEIEEFANPARGDSDVPRRAGLPLCREVDSFAASAAQAVRTRVLENGMELSPEHVAILSKVRRRLLPILMLCYFAAFLDRVNIGFAALKMNDDLHLTATAFGAGAGLFFLGYVVCEIPSNLILAKVGARTWIARIMITWGIISACTAFVWDRNSFYGVRIALGAAEAGFFPGLLFYCTLWFPSAYRARIYGLTQIAVPISSVIGAPLSSLILTTLDGAFGFKGWQWLFLIEGAPALIMGVVVWLALPSRPEDAKFLTAAEKTTLIDLLARERTTRERTEKFSIWQAMTDMRVAAMCVIALGLVIGTTGAAIWMPQFVKAFGLSTMQVGLVTAIPSLVAVVVTLFAGWNADRTGARVAHVAVPFLCAAIGFVLAAITASPVIGLLGLVIGTAGIAAGSPSVWVLPTALLTGTASAAGLALINATGSTGGFFGPYVIGWVRDATGSFSMPLLFLAAVMAAAAGVVIVLGRQMRTVLNPERFRALSAAKSISEVGP